MKTQFENLNIAERISRFAVSYIVIVGALNSPWVGSSLYAVVNMIAIALATTGIIGWDPVRAMSVRVKDKYLHHDHQAHGVK